MPEISICLPLYNGERYLSQALDSALGQTYGDFELLISDDCSTDASEQIVQPYAQADKRVIYWRNETNLGLFANYNEAQNRASGKLIKPFAQDDLWAPTILEKMHSCFRSQQGLALVSVARQWISADGAALPTHCQFSQDTRLDGAAVIKDSLLNLVNWVGEPSTVMYPRAIAGNGFDTKFYHLGDLDYWLRLVTHGDYFYLHEPLCSFRRHEGSTTNRNLKGLLFAIDMLLLGEQHSASLTELGISLREFALNGVANISTYVNHLTNREELSIADVLAIKPHSDQQAREQLDQFKALAYFSLLALAEHRAIADVKLAESLDERYNLEEELSGVLNSSWWTSTEPLRAVARRLRQ